MTQILDGETLDALRTAMSGVVIGPADDDYDRARAVWNGEIDRRPAAVARCASSADVVAALAFAHERGLEVAVRGGGHNASGAATCDDGLVIDLGLLDHAVVDPDTRLVRVGGGAKLCQLDAATQAHGLAVPVGMIGQTGVGGLTLGGGMGWLTRRAGLAIDNLVSAEVVTADGRVLRVSATGHPDLFWAIRGGGGNFGVVTEFEFRCQEVGQLVQLGMFFYDLDDGTEVMRLMRDLMPTLGRDLNVGLVAVTAPPAPFVPPEYHFRPGYLLMVIGFGDAGEHAAALDRIRAAAAPLFETVTPIPHVQLQQLQDDSAPWGIRVYEKSAYLRELSDEAIAVIAAHVPHKPTPTSLVQLYSLDGAYGDVADDDTAFGGSRSSRFCVFVIAAGTEEAELDTGRAWVRGFADALSPAATGGGYVNAMAEYSPDLVRSTYGPAKLDRLRRIKTEYDPGNVFHRNVNITPV